MCVWRLRGFSQIEAHRNRWVWPHAKQSGRKRAIGTRASKAIPQRPNKHWPLGLMLDAFSDARWFRILCIIGDFCQECPAAVVDMLLSGTRVARELDRIAEMRRHSCIVLSDNITLADVYSGRDKTIPQQRERIKRRTLEALRVQH